MNRVNIAFEGINRSMDDGISKDGQTAELVNMRVKGGSLQPVGRPVRLALFGREPVYIHKNAGYEHYISISGDSVYYDYYRDSSGFHGVSYLIGQISGGLVSVESVGNLLIVISTVEMYYYLWSGEGYGFLGNAPELPLFTAGSDQIYQEGSITGYVSAKTEETISGDHFGYVRAGADKKLIDDAYQGIIAKALYYAKDKQKVGNVIFMRYALRLIDGSLILHSPVYTFHPRDGWSYITTSRDDDNNVTMAVYIKYEDPFMVCSDSRGIASWSSIVSSVDFFAAEVDYFNGETPQFLLREYGDLANLSGKENLTLSMDLAGAFEKIDGFHYVGSIGIDQIVAGARFDFTNVSKGIRHNLVQQEIMEHDNLSQHSSIGGCSYVYNGRLIIGDITTKLNNPHNAAYYTYNIGSVGSSLYAQSAQTISTENGVATVVGVDGKYYNIAKWQPVLVATDYRATDLQLRTGSSNQKFKLKKHPLLSLAYYQTSDLEPIELASSISTTPVESNTVHRDSRKIKVSGLNNPIVFPVANTYTVSNGDIQAFQSVTTALSTGQFGQFPLYVFATDGVYALETGTGSVVYTRATPVTRDCLANKHSIVSVDNAVVFATEGSLIMIAGSQSVNISQAIEGYLPSFVDSSPIITKAANVVGYAGLISSTEFRNYIDNCRVGYCYEDKEIIVSNASYPYSYAYNMTSGSWHKISGTINRYLNSYPECLFVSNGDSGYALYDMYNPVRTVNNVFLLTKPIKFGTTTHKRVLQSAIRGTLRPSKSDVYLRGENVHYRDVETDIFSNAGFYILGSNDAEHFVLVAGREKIADVRDLITKMNKSKAYKYFMIALSGGVRTDVSLNYIEMMVESTMDNRLR